MVSDVEVIVDVDDKAEMLQPRVNFVGKAAEKLGFVHAMPPRALERHAHSAFRGDFRHRGENLLYRLERLLRLVSRIVCPFVVVVASRLAGDEFCPERGGVPQVVGIFFRTGADFFLVGMYWIEIRAEKGNLDAVRIEPIADFRHDVIGERPRIPALPLDSLRNRQLDAVEPPFMRGRAEPVGAPLPDIVRSYQNFHKRTPSKKK